PTVERRTTAKPGLEAGGVSARSPGPSHGKPGCSVRRHAGPTTWSGSPRTDPCDPGANGWRGPGSVRRASPPEEASMLGNASAAHSPTGPAVPPHSGASPPDRTVAPANL